MSYNYDSRTLVNLNDLRELIQQEFTKIFEKLNLQDKGLKLPPKSSPQFDKTLHTKPLSIQQLADRYEVSKATIHNWRKQKLITGFKMGKGRFFHIEEVEKNLTQYRYLDVLESKGLIEKRKTIY